MNDHKWSVANTLYFITIIITVSGSLLLAYWNVLQALNAEQVALASYEARLTIAEKALAARQEADERFASEMRAALSKINDGVSDLRVQEARRLK